MVVSTTSSVSSDSDEAVVDSTAARKNPGIRCGSSDFSGRNGHKGIEICDGFE